MCRNAHQCLRLPIVGKILRRNWRDRYGKLAGQNFQLSRRRIVAGDIIRGYCFPIIILEYRFPFHFHCFQRHIGYFLALLCHIRLPTDLVGRVAWYLNLNLKLSRVLLAIIGEFILRNFNVNVHAQHNGQRRFGESVNVKRIVACYIVRSAINDLHILNTRSDRILARRGDPAIILHARLHAKRMAFKQVLRLQTSYVHQIGIVVISAIVIYRQRVLVKLDLAQRTRNDGILLLGRQTVIFAFTGDRDGNYRAGIVPARFLNGIIRTFRKRGSLPIYDFGAPRFAVR